MGNVDTTSGRCCPLFWPALYDECGRWWGLGEEAADPPEGANIDAGGDGNNIDFVLRSISKAANEADSSWWLLLEDDFGEDARSYAPGKSEFRGKEDSPLPQLGDLEAKLNISMSNLSSWLLLSSLRWDCDGWWCNGGLQLRFNGPEDVDGGVPLEDDECVVDGEELSLAILMLGGFCWIPNWICCWELVHPL